MLEMSIGADSSGVVVSTTLKDKVISLTGYGFFVDGVSTKRNNINKEVRDELTDVRSAMSRKNLYCNIVW